MSNKLAVLALALALPGTASAFKWGDAGDITVDAYVAPNMKVEEDDGSGTREYREVFGFKSAMQVYDWLGAMLEYQNQHGIATVTGPAAIKVGGTTNEWRIGPGAVASSGSGIFVQYVSQKTGDLTLDGFGVRGRLAAHPVPDLNAYLEVGQFTLKDDADFEQKALEAAIGGALAITDAWGLYTEYKLTQYEPNGTADDYDVEEVRVGVRARFDL